MCQRNVNWNSIQIRETTSKESRSESFEGASLTRDVVSIFVGSILVSLRVFLNRKLHFFGKFCQKIGNLSLPVVFLSLYQVSPFRIVIIFHFILIKIFKFYLFYSQPLDPHLFYSDDLCKITWFWLCPLD